MKHRHFIPESAGTRGGVYTCLDCGKKTRETGECESNVSLCVACYDSAGLKNEHTDGFHDTEPHPDCVDCNEHDIPDALVS